MKKQMNNNSESRKCANCKRMFEAQNLKVLFPYRKGLCFKCFDTKNGQNIYKSILNDKKGKIQIIMWDLNNKKTE